MYEIIIFHYNIHITFLFIYIIHFCFIYVFLFRNTHILRALFCLAMLQKEIVISHIKQRL